MGHRNRGGMSVEATAVDPREVLLTPQGLQKLEQELEFLKSVRRREIAERIKVAREFGDLAENAEYDEAKNEQAFVESRIAILEKTLRHARVVVDEELDPRAVNVGSTVTLQDLDTGDIATYTIVGSHEGNPKERRISYESPVGRAVLGRTVGDTVEVRLPGGVARYRVVALTR